MKILFFANGMKMDGEIWGVYWQEPNEVAGKVLDPNGKIFDHEEKHKHLKDLFKEAGAAAETFVIDMDKKAAIAMLGKKKDLLDKHKQVAL